MPAGPMFPPVTVAAIDIGTNTVLLLVARVASDGLVVPLVYEQRIPRLGRGVDAARRLAADSMERVVSTLEEYQLLIRGHAPDAIAVFGTSAVRDASNRDALASLITRRTGYRLEVLSGAEEALLTYRGAISGIRGIAGATVVDIGGGSTEITSGAAGEILGSASLDIGSVRLTERFFRRDPP
ncbi:MAG TPA: Ppx/GppA family phosphatase, partial [Bacteroidota bacterium]